MAKVNKPAAISQMTGIGSPPIAGGGLNAAQPAIPKALPNNGIAAGQMMAKGPDNIPAMVHDQDGNPQEPAAIKQGEIIMPVEAVIGAGNGDYNKGAEMLLNLMEKLKAHGLAVSQGQ